MYKSKGYIVLSVMIQEFYCTNTHEYTNIPSYSGKLVSDSSHPQGGGGGGTLIFSYIRTLGSFFGVQNFEFQYFCWVFRKMNIFGGMKILWIFFGGHNKIGLNLGVISMHFRVFS